LDRNVTCATEAITLTVNPATITRDVELDIGGAFDDERVKTQAELEDELLLQIIGEWLKKAA
jgi:hypothetical protein